jgi:hypothetical protein
MEIQPAFHVATVRSGDTPKNKIIVMDAPGNSAGLRLMKGRRM